VRSLKNIASGLRSRMVKSKSDFRRSSAPPPLTGNQKPPPPPPFASFSFTSKEAVAPSSDLPNPLSSNSAQDLRRPLVIPSEQRGNGEGRDEELHDTYLSPASPVPTPLSRLFKAQSAGSPLASPAPSRPQSSRTPSSRGLFGGEYLTDPEGHL
jgi:hypothetical protein